MFYLASVCLSVGNFTYNYWPDLHGNCTTTDGQGTHPDSPWSSSSSSSSSSSTNFIATQVLNKTSGPLRGSLLSKCSGSGTYSRQTPNVGYHVDDIILQFISEQRGHYAPTSKPSPSASQSGIEGILPHRHAVTRTMGVLNDASSA